MQSNCNKSLAYFFRTPENACITTQLGIKCNCFFCSLTTHIGQKGEFFLWECQLNMGELQSCVLWILVRLPLRRRGPSVINPSCCCVRFPPCTFLYIFYVWTWLCVLFPPYCCPLRSTLSLPPYLLPRSPFSFTPPRWRTTTKLLLAGQRGLSFRNIIINMKTSKK